MPVTQKIGLPYTGWPGMEMKMWFTFLLIMEQT
jgi:hypothetical protein